MSAISFRWADFSHLAITVSLMGVEARTRMPYEKSTELRDSIHWSRRYEYPWAYIALLPYSKDEVILDVGSDGTPLQFMLAGEVGQVYSLDIEPSCVACVQAVKEANGIANIHPTLGDVTHLEFPDAFRD